MLLNSELMFSYFLALSVAYKPASCQKKNIQNVRILPVKSEKMQDGGQLLMTPLKLLFPSITSVFLQEMCKYARTNRTILTYS